VLKIVEYRKNKKVLSGDELVNIKGVGDKTLERIRGRLTVAMKKTKK